MTGCTHRRAAWRGSSPWPRCRGLLAGLLAAAACLPAAAVQPGQTDSFAAGLQGWRTGNASPVPATRVDGGGPGGVDDAYLLLRATGDGGAGSKLVAIAGPQWTGDYLAAGVTGVSMWLRNEGDTDLSLRLWLRAAGGASFSLQPVLLAPGSGWQAARFSLLPAALTGPAATVLAGVQELRLYHGLTAAFPDADIAARLGVDQVTAVPEPASAALWLAGLAALGAWARRRPRRATGRCTANLQE